MFATYFTQRGLDCKGTRNRQSCIKFGLFHRSAISVTSRILIRPFLFPHLQSLFSVTTKLFLARPIKKMYHPLLTFLLSFFSPKPFVSEKSFDGSFPNNQERPVNIYAPFFLFLINCLIISSQHVPDKYFTFSILFITFSERTTPDQYFFFFPFFLA